jgi:carboxymethylenebutenolidase
MAATDTNLIEETLALKSSDDVSIKGYRIRPAGAVKGAVIILQEIFGLTDQMKSVVRFYASQGYDTIFPCFYDRVQPGLMVPFDEIERARSLAAGLDQGKVIADIAAAAEAVKNPNGVSVIGFCWGGGVIVRAAADVALKGAIAFYGTRLETFLEHKAKCPLLFHFGETDHYSPPEVIAQVRQTFPQAQTHVYEAGHGFANDVRPSFNPQATELAVDRTLGFLAQVHAG